MRGRTHQGEGGIANGGSCVLMMNDEAGTAVAVLLVANVAENRSGAAESRL
jgi:hypothetical protein